jgi:hypothetical protein
LSLHKNVADVVAHDTTYAAAGVRPLRDLSHMTISGYRLRYPPFGNAGLSFGRGELRRAQVYSPRSTISAYLGSRQTASVLNSFDA